MERRGAVGAARSVRANGKLSGSVRSNAWLGGVQIAFFSSLLYKKRFSYQLR
jgi:hypothetical protein